jgi:L-amino acid N-acyltransferase
MTARRALLGERTHSFARLDVDKHILVSQAEDAHLRGITDIYNDAVSHTTAIWNDVRVDVDNRKLWLRERSELGYPVLVASDEVGQVLGYASFGNFRPFDGYKFTVENSVYVRSDFRHCGIGRALLESLMERAKLLGKHRMVAAIEATNYPSIRLHETLGFQPCGTMKEVGFKFGRWLDLAWLSASL